METTLKLTELELLALDSILSADFYENGKESIVWDFSVYDICKIPKKSRAGVFSSLSQKDLISITEKEKPFVTDANGNKIRNKYYERGGTNFGRIYITKEGYELLTSLNLINEDGYKIKSNW